MLSHSHTSNITEQDPGASIATILSANTEVPISCDNCGLDSDYRIGFLRKLPTISCRYCADTRSFSALEFDVLGQVLKQMGYFLAR